MQHSINTLVTGLLSSELIESIAAEKPCYIPNTGLPTIIDVEETVRLGAQVATSTYNRVDVSGDGVCRYASAPKRAITREYLDQLRRGYTLRVNYLDWNVPVLKLLCATLKESIGVSIAINAYLGNDGSRAIGPHWDDHDVLIWQQEGRKIWNVANYTNTRTILEEVELSPGGLLYIPVGYFHWAQTLPGQDSLHLTLGTKN